MFESILNFFKKLGKNESNKETNGSKKAAKERLHLVLMQDRANVSADFLELMKQEIIEVIKKYIEVDENEIDVRLTNEVKEDGTTGAPSLYANIPIVNIRNEMKKEVEEENKNKEENKEILNDSEKNEDNNEKKEIEKKEETEEKEVKENDTETKKEENENNEAEKDDKSEDVSEK